MNDEDKIWYEAMKNKIRSNSSSVMTNDERNRFVDLFIGKMPELYEEYKSRVSSIRAAAYSRKWQRDNKDKCF